MAGTPAPPREREQEQERKREEEGAGERGRERECVCERERTIESERGWGRCVYALGFMVSGLRISGVRKVGGASLRMS